MPSVCEFGPFHLDPAERLLLREGTPVALTPKAFDVLVHLVTRHGHLVTKQELLDSVWAGTFVEEANLTYTISALRRALGDGQHGERFIQTVPTKGYRFVAAVSQAGSTSSPAPGRSSRDRRRARAWAIVVAGAVIAALAGGLAMMRVREAPPVDADVARFTIALPDTELAANWMHPVAISPNGANIALLLGIPGSLWIRPLHATQAEYFSGTENARGMVWAPDSSQLAVALPEGLKVLRLSDRSWRTLCNGCQLQGYGSWTTRGLIVFGSAEGPIMGVPEGGGQPVPLTRVDRARGEALHGSPQELPGGRLLFWVWAERADARGLHVVDTSLPPESAAHTRVLSHWVRTAEDAAAGYYLLQPQDGHIVASRLDLKTLSAIGSPVTLVERERFSRAWFGGIPDFSTSTTGILVYSIVEHPQSQFQWFDRAGRHLSNVAEPDWYFTLDLSPDERYLATTRLEEGSADVWAFDLARTGWTRRTFGPAGHFTDPRWMSDGEGLVVMSWPGAPRPYRVMQVDGDDLSLGTRVPEYCVLDDVSRDGQYLVCRPRPRIMVLRLPDATEGRIIYAPPGGTIDQPEMSPDSRWVAFNGNDSGRMEVYVVPVEQAGPRQAVSVNGGVQPRWRADGRELFYLGLDGTLFAVTVESGSDGRLVLSTPVRLFSSGLTAPSQEVEQYAVSNDGQRFLFLLPLDNRIRRSVGVLQNWPALVRAAAAPTS